MIRRKFLGLAALAGAGGAAGLAALEHGEKKTVTYRVSGFTCITCAVGLETLLKREDGVLAVSASYPDSKAVITYRPHVISEDKIISTIQEMGFTPQKLSDSHEA